MSAMPITDAVYQAIATVRRQTGQFPTAIHLAPVTVFQWQDEAHDLLTVLNPTAVDTADRFMGVTLHPDPTVPPAQIDVIDCRGGRVLVRIEPDS